MYSRINQKIYTHFAKFWVEMLPGKLGLKVMFAGTTSVVLRGSENVGCGFRVFTTTKKARAAREIFLYGTLYKEKKSWWS